jgi:adenylate cyclase
MEQKLSVIVACDVVGYSRLMGIDERGTLSALKKHRHELFETKIAEHRGRTVKFLATECWLNSKPQKMRF